jgi:hypothetical protein
MKRTAAILAALALAATAARAVFIQVAVDPATGVLPNRIEWREGRVVRRHRTSGRSSVTLCCPFCSAHVTAYLWSLAGGGKRCYCGAMAGGNGNFYHFADRKA